MPNVFTACWTMSEQIFGGNGALPRANQLLSMALYANHLLSVAGNAAGGAYHRIFVIPEYFFAAGGQLSSRGNKHVIYKRLETISAQVPDLILIAGTIAYRQGTFNPNTYNVCPILFGGTIVKKLYKANDDGVYQINGTFRTKTDNGKGVPIATINGLRIGLDICMDYTNDRLRQYLATANEMPPDIHIQISGTNPSSASRAAARVNGVYIHCDLGGRGERGATAWRVAAQDAILGATTTEIDPRWNLIPFPGGRMIIFDTSV